MKYQCEVCGMEHTFKFRALRCLHQHKMAACVHDWYYHAVQDDDLCRTCEKCGMEDGIIGLEQSDLADLWERKTKEKEAT